MKKCQYTVCMAQLRLRELFRMANYDEICQNLYDLSLNLSQVLNILSIDPRQPILYFCFFFQSCFICRPSDSILCRRMLGYRSGGTKALFISFLLYTVHSYSHIHSLHSLRSARVSSWLQAQVEGLFTGVPSRDSNSGPPYSSPACYQLSHAAPY
jgi:hypothetical protein